jgi:hypothetical protein
MKFSLKYCDNNYMEKSPLYTERSLDFRPNREPVRRSVYRAPGGRTR